MRTWDHMRNHIRKVLPDHRHHSSVQLLLLPIPPLRDGTSVLYPTSLWSTDGQMVCVRYRTKAMQTTGCRLHQLMARWKARFCSLALLLRVPHRAAYRTTPACRHSQRTSMSPIRMHQVLLSTLLSMALARLVRVCDEAPQRRKTLMAHRGRLRSQDYQAALPAQHPHRIRP